MPLLSPTQGPINIVAPTFEKVNKIQKYDRAYLDAVESSDMETAQRMVDEAIDKFYKTIRRVKAFLKFDNPLIVDQYGTVTDDDIRDHDGIIDLAALVPAFFSYAESYA